MCIRDSIRAKVTDFGMARLSDLNPQATNFTNTMCPGTDVYMPPEAVQDKPLYSEKIDCFSFGVITVQILTRQFPKPGDRYQNVELNHPGLPTGTPLLVRVPEVNRRQNHVSEVDPNHPLLPVTLDCLKDNEKERPSAQQLCERVAVLKQLPKYSDSTRTFEDKDKIKDCTIAIKEEEIQQLRQILQQGFREKDQVLEDKDGQLEEREMQLRRLNKQLETSEQMTAQFVRP